ncbi:hypothetical protein HK105_206421 [Polyrhizophydium stewartii]|uniref:Uncharacterized protein n=1 Tax=Polyrhizophydium stewartii TaxID=2732419 RepID=A0ABR4N3E8_9FUNG
MRLPTLAKRSPQLDAVVRHLEEIKDNLAARAADITVHMAPPPRSASPPCGLISPYAAEFDSLASPSASPTGPLPFQRAPLAASTPALITHWLYEMQKGAWLLNEKLKKYLAQPSAALMLSYHTRKIVDFGLAIRSAWVQLLLQVSIAMSDANAETAAGAHAKVDRLAVATGAPSDWQDLLPDDAKSIYMQGEKYFIGYGVAKSHDVAFKRYEVAARMGLPEAANMLGIMHEFGLGREKDIAAATRWYRRGAEGGCAEALNNIGRLYELGKGCEVSLAIAADMYKRAADHGHLDGMTNYGYMLEHGLGRKQDLQLATEMYRAAADAGYARAQNALGSCLFRGRGVRRDYTDALTWYRKAADQGFPPAQNNLGICFEEGHGVARDPLMAKIYYRKAADARHPSGSNNLGYMLLAEGDYLGAMQMFHVALSLGSIDAAYHLGTIFESGCLDKGVSVVTKQPELALQYYRIAADRGHTRAQVRIATLLLCLDEHGTPLSIVDARADVESRDPQVPALPGPRPHEIAAKQIESRIGTEKYDMALRYLLMAATPAGTIASIGGSTGSDAALQTASATASGVSLASSLPPPTQMHLFGTHGYRQERQTHDRHTYGPYPLNGEPHQSPYGVTGIASDVTTHAGDPDAQNMLGELFELGFARGLDGDGDAAVAAAWYRKALRQGHARATFNLAALYEAGSGVGRDFDKAVRLYREAARRGSTDAAERLAELAELPSTVI